MPTGTDGEVGVMPENMDVTPVEGAEAVVDEASAVQGDDATSGDQQPELNEGGVKALKAERDARRKLERELASLRKVQQEREDAEKSELQRAQEAAARLQEELTGAKRAAFAAGKGIPEDLLSGATPDEWEASAERLLAFRGAAQPVTQTAPRAAGVQGNTGQPVTTTAGQLSQADVQKMYAAKDYDGINKARAEGRLNTILGIN